MKIIILNRAMGIGGAERQIVTLAGGLRERGHDISVAVFYGGHPLERTLGEAGVPLHDLGKKGRWDVVGFPARLIRLLRRERPDVLYAFRGESNCFGALARPFLGGKLVWGVRDTNLDLGRPDRVSRLAYRIECALSGLPDLVISNSRSGLDHAQTNGFPAGDRSVVIPNGIDTERYHPDPEAGRRVRAELGIAADEPLVGIVGRLDPKKDHPSFLKAAAILAEARPKVRFVCVGPGPEPYARELRALSDSLGLGSRVAWTGPRADMKDVYNALDLLALSSLFEGFPNVLGEAMACGKPCVATDAGDSSWVVGDCGQVIPHSDPAALASAMARTLDRISAGEISPECIRGRVVANFSRARLVDATEAALLGLRGGVAIR